MNLQVTKTSNALNSFCPGCTEDVRTDKTLSQRSLRSKLQNLSCQMSHDAYRKTFNVTVGPNVKQDDASVSVMDGGIRPWNHAASLM